ncbi:MAG: protein kinase [Myxococcales bacterium]|nr:protein kinase [Myxococcales bacterium]MDP3501237.1 protein kinase [Myxococcales bacterium]
MSQGATKERLRPFKPQRFGRYTLLRPLSMGGMGEIFLARLEGAQGFEKLCVIKKILPHLAQDKDFVDRFVDEARILVKLSHGNIAQVLDMGLHEGAPYIALEFIDGKDLRRVVARAHERALTLPLSFILYVATRLLDALAYAHRKKGDEGKELNLVHRDVSPQNILISYEGEVKVIDFGLAKSTMSATHTHPSIVLGKFLYMSPEQARHQKADKRSDLYAVGLCLYELIAGKSPFDGIAPGELMATVASPKIAPLTSIEPLCPPALNDAVMKSLSVDPAQRFQTAEELRGRLLTILMEIDQAAGPETATRFMTEAFANEYQSERKLLAELSQQARDLPEEVAQEEETLDPTASGVTREVQARPTLTLDEIPQARVTAPEVKASPSAAAPIDPLASIQALSFQPTRKAPSASGEKKARPEDPSTLPSIVVASEARMTDQVPVPPPPAMPQQSIVLDDGLSEQSDARARTLPETRPPRGGAAPAPMKSDPARKSQSRTTGAGIKAPGRNGKTEKSDAKKAVTQKATPLDNPQTLTPDQTPAPGADAPTPAPSAAKSGSSVLVWVALPVLAIAAVGGYIAWDVYTERLRAQHLTDEPSDPVPMVATPTGPERSREVKLQPDPPPPSIEPEDLPGIAKDPKKPKPSPKVEPKAISREQMSMRTKEEIERSINDQAEKRTLIMAVNKLEGSVPAGDNATFVAELAKIRAKVKEIVAKQNQ